MLPGARTPLPLDPTPYSCIWTGNGFCSLGPSPPGESVRGASAERGGAANLPNRGGRRDGNASLSKPRRPPLERKRNRVRILSKVGGNHIISAAPKTGGKASIWVRQIADLRLLAPPPATGRHQLAAGKISAIGMQLENINWWIDIRIRIWNSISHVSRVVNLSHRSLDLYTP
jgi:hypothetical protein